MARKIVGRISGIENAWIEFCKLIVQPTKAITIEYEEIGKFLQQLFMFLLCVFKYLEYLLRVIGCNYFYKYVPILLLLKHRCSEGALREKPRS